jgi:hypothetical protein
MTARYAPGVDSIVGPAVEPWWPQRSDVTLYHELTHALHGIEGTTQPFVKPSLDELLEEEVGNDIMPTPVLMEEWATVGLGPFADDPITENKYREERRALAGQPGMRAGDDASSMVRRDQYLSWDED